LIVSQLAFLSIFNLNNKRSYWKFSIYGESLIVKAGNIKKYEEKLFICSGKPELFLEKFSIYLFL